MVEVNLFQIKLKQKKLYQNLFNIFQKSNLSDIDILIIGFLVPNLNELFKLFLNKMKVYKMKLKWKVLHYNIIKIYELFKYSKVNYLHSNYTIHPDFQLENIMFVRKATSVKKYTLKIIAILF